VKKKTACRFHPHYQPRRQALRRVVRSDKTRDEAALRGPACSYEKSYGSFVLRATTDTISGLIKGGEQEGRRRWRRRQGGASQRARSRGSGLLLFFSRGSETDPASFLSPYPLYLPSSANSLDPRSHASHLLPIVPILRVSVARLTPSGLKSSTLKASGPPFPMPYGTMSWSSRSRLGSVYLSLLSRPS
jgi:hypothetical protein